MDETPSKLPLRVPCSEVVGLAGELESLKGLGSIGLVELCAGGFGGGSLGLHALEFTAAS